MTGSPPDHAALRALAPQQFDAHHRSLLELQKPTTVHSIEVVLGRIGAAAQAFHALLSAVSAGESATRGSGWIQQPWGPHLKNLADDGYAHMANSMLRFAAESVRRLEEAGRAAPQKLVAETRHALGILGLYRQHAILPHERCAELAALEERAEAGKRER